MTSHSTDSPACPEGHGLMVPIDYEMCYAPLDGFVTAVVEYRANDDGIFAVGYAMHEQARNCLPSGDKMGDQIEALRQSGVLVGIHDVIDAGNGYLRIDDNRPGHNWGYMIWLEDDRKDSVSFMPRVVYHFFDNKQEEHEFPRLQTFDEVVALMTDPSARVITSYSDDVAKKNGDDPTVVSELGDLENRVVVWDRGAIQRSGRERKAEAADLD